MYMLGPWWKQVLHSIVFVSTSSCTGSQVCRHFARSNACRNGKYACSLCTFNAAYLLLLLLLSVCFTSPLFQSQAGSYVGLQRIIWLNNHCSGDFICWMPFPTTDLTCQSTEWQWYKCTVNGSGHIVDSWLESEVKTIKCWLTYLL